MGGAWSTLEPLQRVVGAASTCIWQVRSVFRDEGFAADAFLPSSHTTRRLKCFGDVSVLNSFRSMHILVPGASLAVFLYFLGHAAPIGCLPEGPAGDLQGTFWRAWWPLAVFGAQRLPCGARFRAST